MSVADVLDAVTTLLATGHGPDVQVHQGTREGLTITKDRLVLVGLRVSGADESPVMSPGFGALKYDLHLASSASITSSRDQASANRAALAMWAEGVGFLRDGLNITALGLLQAVPGPWSLTTVATPRGRDAAVGWVYHVEEDYA